jgi:hypothetical protein
MALFQGAFFLILGVGLGVLAFQGFSKGWLPFGSNGLKGRLELRRDESPFGFWLAFGMYALGGSALAIYALALLLGVANPLPVR